MVGAAILEVTADDVARLDDVDLRSLVARLAEATLRRQGLPTAAVTWGGDQNAPDGGLDVRVTLPPGTPMGGFIPRPSTGIQVKKPGMLPSDILAEMRPGGVLRPVIADLAAAGGAYVIVSSGSPVSDAALRRRLEAMAMAVSDDPSRHRLAVDFYDRQRLATWVGDHPGLVPWVRAKAGRPIRGWQSYGDWSHAGDGPARAFITDDEARLHEGRSGRGRVAETGLPILEGLGRVRAVLLGGERSVRLVGLSGVGKTRFAEALFDERLGSNPLPPCQALYADLGHHPEPSPIAMATHLLQAGMRALLIVDNCPPEVHEKLALLCKVTGSLASLLTIEYDIRDDQPEGTDVFRLEAASPDLVARLVSARFPTVSPVDADTIGRFSGGNARVGIALADTLERGDSLAGLSNEALFQRLFRQRHDDSPGLLAAAEACALVYSFNVDPLPKEEAELPLLAALAGCSVRELHAHAAELGRRGLLQARGRWRAVLPHAIANRLAARALDNLQPSEIRQRLVDAAPGRLLRSFSRRLGYLYDSPAAVRIADEWLSEAGMLADVADLSPLGLAILRNVAPASPRAALAALARVGEGKSADRLFSTDNRHRRDLARLLRQIAYDPARFDVSVSLLARFAEARRGTTRSTACSTYSGRCSRRSCRAPWRRLSRG